MILNGEARFLDIRIFFWNTPQKTNMSSKKELFQ